MAERSPEPIRLGIEDYLKEASGQNAQITDIGAVEIVPDISLELKEILIQEKTQGKSLLKAKRALIAMPFSSVFLGGGKYHSFELEKLETASGFFLPQKLVLEYAGISSKNPALGEAYYMAEGRYNNQPLLFTADMMMDSRGKKPVFYFHDEFSITLKLGKTEMSGRYVRARGGVDIRGVEIRRGEKIMQADILNIQQNPFYADFTGNHNGQTFSGTIEKKSGALLLIVNASDTNAIEGFLNPVLKDFGLYERDDLIKIEMKQEQNETRL